MTFITEYQSSFDIFDAHKMAGWTEFNNLAWEVIEMIEVVAIQRNMKGR